MLTGGKSRRMGQDKAAVLLGGRPLLGHMLVKLEQLRLPARVAGPTLPGYEWITFVPDECPGRGPMSGLETALRHSDNELVLVLGIDLPLLSVALLEALIRRAQSSGSMATIPRVLGRPQPLCAVYRRELSPAITRLLAADTLKVMQSVQLAAAATAGPADVAGRVDTFDLEMLVPAVGLRLERPVAWEFLNCNTPADAAMAEQLLQQEAKLQLR